MENPDGRNSELNHLQKELKFSEVKFNTIAQTATDSIVIADQDSRILFFNKKAQDTFGYTEDEIIGKSLTVIMPSRYREGHLAGMRRFIGTGVPKLIGRTVELEGLRKDGTTFPLELSLSSWKEDEHFYFCGIIRDITERKNVQTGLELLATITASINEAEDFYSALKITIANVCKVLGWNFGEAWLPDKNREHIFFAPVYYISDDRLLELVKVSENLLLKPGQGMPGRVYEGNVEWHPDITLKPDTFYRKEIAMKSGLKSGLGIPIKANGDTLAVLLFYKYEVESPEENIKKIVVSICNQLGSLLRNKQSEEKLKESQFLIRQIADSSPAMILVYDRINKDTVYSNRELQHVLGYTEQQVSEMRDALVNEMVHPEDKKKVEEREEKIEKAADGEVVESEIRVKAMNGEWKWLYTRTTVFKRTPEGKLWQTLSISIDITDIKLVEERLHESEIALRALNSNLEQIVELRTRELKDSEDRLRIAIEATKLGTWDYNPLTQKFIWNERFKELFEFAPEEKVTFEKCLEKIYPEDRDRVVKALSWALNPESKGLFHVEHRIFSLQDEYHKKWIKSEGQAFFDEQGKPYRFIGAALDITENKKSMERVLKANRELKKINSDLDNFIYTASHDLKAPVSNIEGLINTLCDALNEQNKVDEEIQELIDMMGLSIKRFQNTIRDLTEISKVQRNIYDDIAQINVTEVIQDVIGSIQLLIENNNAAIHVHTEQCPEISFSKINFRSIVYNLLTNAIKYKSPERDPVVNVSCYNSGEYSILEFQDNGLGIREEHKDKIFKMFMRMHHHVEGTGVGLYLVKRIVDNSGGKIEVEGEPGKGSVFRVYLKNKTGSEVKEK